MENLVIGTAGHIDHGKTTLIKALTGRVTDTLAEEIKRGISINLGFTYFDLPCGVRAGIIDVPGHEKFIKNMIAGASGIDVVLVAVAANEGIKPQTTEHLDILSYLNIKEAIFVLTKWELADEIMRELVLEDVKDFIAAEQKRDHGSVLGRAGIACVDSVSGFGLNELIAKINAHAQNLRSKSVMAPARLGVDRVFSLKGFGTIVTGTLTEGKIRTGDALLVYPAMLETKVRTVQVHESVVDTAFAGQRTALNLPNLKVTQLSRGDVLAPKGTLKPTDQLDATVSLVPHTTLSLKTWSRLRIYLGSNEVLGRFIPLDTNKLEAGESCFCQLRLETPVVVRKGDRFVFRNYSPLATIGGGVVLDANPAKHKKTEQALLDALAVKASGGFSDLMDDYIKSRGAQGAAVSDIAAYMQRPETEIMEILTEWVKSGLVFGLGGAYLHMQTVEALRVVIVEALERFHHENPLKAGMPKDALRQKVKMAPDAKSFDTLLALFDQECIVKATDNAAVALRRFNVSLSPKQQAAKLEMEQTLLDARFAPPPISDLVKPDKKLYGDVLEAMIPEQVIRLDGETALHRIHYEAAKDALLTFLDEHGEVSLAEFRDLLGATRKYALLLLEDFDKRRITRRFGEKRKLW